MLNVRAERVFTTWTCNKAISHAFFNILPDKSSFSVFSSFWYCQHIWIYSFLQIVVNLNIGTCFMSTLKVVLFWKLNIPCYKMQNSLFLFWLHLESSAMYQYSFFQWHTTKFMVKHSDNSLSKFLSSHQGHWNGGALRGHCSPALWKGRQQGHRCPYMPAS